MARPRNIEFVEASFAKFLTPDATLETMRIGYDEMCPAVAGDVAVKEGKLGGIPGRWVEPKGAGAGVVLYFHGGGYVIGSARSHTYLAADIAKAGNVKVFVVDYRRAPENPFPAAVDDAVAAYKGLLASGVPADKVAFAGDSAGGGLTLAALHAVRAAKLPQPKCAVTLSAWADLSCTLPAIEGNTELDPFVTPDIVRSMAHAYIGESGNVRDPLVSPLHGDFAGFPPLLMQVGSDEILLDDTLRVAQKAKAADVPVKLTVEDGMIHVYQQLAWIIPEGKAAIAEIGTFLQDHLAK